MSKHLASLRWNRGDKPFTYEGYSRDHEWIFEGGQRLTGSAAEAFLGSPHGVDPEEALVVALSSCHMLTLLAIAAKKGWTVESYEDDAEGTLGKNADGKLSLTHVTLRPRIVFAEGTTLAPCWYCSGLVRQFNIGTVVVGESVNFQGGLDWLRASGVNVIDLQSQECIDLLGDYIRANPEVWNEDIGED